MSLGVCSWEQCPKGGIFGRRVRQRGRAEVTTIYETLGSEGGIKTAVDQFYERVVGDPRLVSYFAGVDMDQLRRHQAALLVAVTGGPQRYSGRDMAAAHAGLDITDEHFDLVVSHLVDTLVSLGVDPATIGQIGGALLPYREQIVTAPARRN